MVPLGVRTAAFFGVPMVVATSASAEEKKKAVPPQSRQSRVMFAIGKRTRRGHAAWSQIDPKATLGRSALLTSVRTFGSARSGPLADLDDGGFRRRSTRTRVRPIDVLNALSGFCSSAAAQSRPARFSR